eukprot:CAMPEP_0119107140 /NCGR_PEP_ID=MMETSP1180-20130426/8395_1 /TAXON_ID=3052 ORGANISM="Chlamydomonas cf sp, Strain CCMP681" /NCGR_SAMPLE_ID=MMETSP1180 /ASSEMBLY_ACC=CAM_ASM_000741 /LENGTH=193 /DNA_ID=CAMNT_0007092583 /DNA_START=40 /DNA_END=621 /DNA_ORIENTATION=-
MASLMKKAGSLSTISRRAVPFSRPMTVLPRAADDSANASSSAPATKSGLVFKNVPQLVWGTDTETIRDVFSFAGPLPERLNGRLAMWAFAAMALAEVQTHTPALEQIGENWLSAVLLTTTILSASILPKLATGRSLKELLATATAENMGGDEGYLQVLKFFTSDLELMTGRVAMLGVVGLVAADLVKGDAFFG